MKNLFLFICYLLSFSLYSQANFEKKLQTQLILAEDGSTIDIDAGTYFLTKSLSLEGKKNITLRGKGIDKTILSFKNQVLCNLISNAIKFSSEGKTIRISASRPHKEYIEIVISDEGIGMPPQILAHLFDINSKCTPK